MIVSAVSQLPFEHQNGKGDDRQAEEQTGRSSSDEPRGQPPGLRACITARRKRHADSCANHHFDCGDAPPEAGTVFKYAQFGQQNEQRCSKNAEADSGQQRRNQRGDRDDHCARSGAVMVARQGCGRSPTMQSGLSIAALFATAGSVPRSAGWHQAETLPVRARSRAGR